MNLSNKKAVIFDMDGVIVDSEKLWKKAEYETFTSLGVKVTEEHSEITKSMTTYEVTKFWYNKFPWKGKDLNTVEQMVISKVISLIETENCEIFGVKSFIEKLKIKNYKIGLATNSPNKIIPIVLNKINILHLFDAISSAEFEEKGKPDPGVYFTTAKKLHIKPENCLVVEDSHSGMLAGKKAGMTVIAFTNGNNKLNFELADYKINCFEKEGMKLLN
ncbi:sugar-phosphatase [Aquimarina amphilecti]|uniref:Sugar-phosphatase n=1 Tax=Aquimarina amphilecti TaxID=1038014 RepID=A0A1H7QZ67_AQUAM|nr:hexitol phosphatase HxpB [Aquimarina amphilecti]SEL52607.1 sugar-phosphatase [Aquimarina amphilecti]